MGLDKEQMIKHAGTLAAKMYGQSQDEGEQGVRQALDALGDAWIYTSPMDWVHLSGARAKGVGTGDVEAVAADLVRLRRGQ